MDKPTYKVFIARADDVNANKRLYPLHEFEKAVEEYNSRNHQFLTVDNMNSNIDLSKIVGVVLNLFLEGNDLYANIQPTETPMKAVIWNDDGIIPGVHVRFVGFGNVCDKGDFVQIDDFRISHLNAHEPAVDVAWTEIG